MKTWLITGCSSGLGRALARAVLEREDQAAVTARDRDKLLEFQKEFPETALTLPLDVTDQGFVDRAVPAIKERFGAVDVLVNNAGCGYRAAVEEGDPQDTEKLFQTLFWGPIPPAAGQ